MAYMLFSDGELDMQPIQEFCCFFFKLFLFLKAGITTRKGGEQSGFGFLTKSQCPRMAGASKNYSIAATAEHSTATESWCFEFYFHL